MRFSRIAAAAAVTAAIALPAVIAPAASAAAPAVPSASCHQMDPYKVHHASAVTIRSKASSKSTALGVLYRSHKFTVHKATKNGEWVYITDKTTGAKGWVSGTYVYPVVYTCLH
ncbi:SH3 domain-containing protein [Streptomyces sp. MS1.AVA.3]|uniref:SH3 domain-containing protein n=1 Tax=Streptomyces decoyicus TaxID=249567 RepID=UPI0030C5706E